MNWRKQATVPILAGGCHGPPPRPAASPGMEVTTLVAHSEGALKLAFFRRKQVAVSLAHSDSIDITNQYTKSLKEALPPTGFSLSPLFFAVP